MWLFLISIRCFFEISYWIIDSIQTGGFRCEQLKPKPTQPQWVSISITYPRFSTVNYDKRFSISYSSHLKAFFFFFRCEVFEQSLKLASAHVQFDKYRSLQEQSFELIENTTSHVNSTEKIAKSIFGNRGRFWSNDRKR